MHINLPGVSSVAGVDLSVTADSVSLEVPGKYKLQLPLRHKISDQQATAKFLTSKQQLVLTLPVALPATSLQASNEHQQGQQLVQELQQQPEQSGSQEQQQAWGKGCEHATGSPQQPAVTPTDLVSTPLSNGSAHPTCSSSHGSLANTGCSNGRQQPCADDAAAATSQPDAAGSSHAPPAAATIMQPQTSSKTQNQVKWEELHEQADTSSHEQDASTTEATASSQQDAAVQPAAAALVPAMTKAAAPLLQPRLSSRLVSSSDFV